MSRIRSIKPDFWSSEQVMTLSRDARLLFIGIWNFADDEGRFRWKARTLKAQVFPGDDVTVAEIETWLAEMVAAELLETYESGTERYGVVTGWHHQRVSHPTPSKYPAPPTLQKSPENSGELRSVPGAFAPDPLRLDPPRSTHGAPESGGERAPPPPDLPDAPPRRAAPPSTVQAEVLEVFRGTYTGKMPRLYGQPLAEAVEQCRELAKHYAKPLDVVARDVCIAAVPGSANWGFQLAKVDPYATASPTLADAEHEKRHPTINSKAITSWK